MCHNAGECLNGGKINSSLLCQPREIIIDLAGDKSNCLLNWSKHRDNPWIWGMQDRTGIDTRVLSLNLSCTYYCWCNHWTLNLHTFNNNSFRLSDVSMSSAAGHVDIKLRKERRKPVNFLVMSSFKPLNQCHRAKDWTKAERLFKVFDFPDHLNIHKSYWWRARATVQRHSYYCVNLLKLEPGMTSYFTMRLQTIRIRQGSSW